jgi:hypothetical protein
VVRRPRIPVWNPPKQPDDSNWRKWLLASLQGDGIRPVRDRFLKGVAGTIIPVLVVLVPGLLALAMQLNFAVGALIGAVAMSVLFKGARQRLQEWTRIFEARGAEDELRHARARPILYLRTFGIDQINKHEHAVMREVRRLGPVIAIGRPGEAFPSLGAARFYVDDAHWQAKVADIAKVSQLVIWVTGATPGLRWELTHLLESIEPEKFVMWADPHLYSTSPEVVEKLWSSFAAAFGNLFPTPLPATLGDTRFIYFKERWQPWVVESRGGRDPQVAAIKFLLDQKGLAKIEAERRRRSRRRSIIAAVAVVAVLVAVEITARLMR